MPEPKSFQSQIILGKNIRYYRERTGQTQEKLAEILGITSKHFSNVERGKRFVTAELLDKLAETFNISFADLFNEKELEKTSKQKAQAKRISATIDAEITNFHESIKKRILDSL